MPLYLNAPLNIEVNEFSDIVVTVDHAVTEERGEGDRPNSFAPDDRLLLNINLDELVREALAEGEDVNFDANSLTVNAQIGVDLRGAELVEGMTVNTGAGDDLIDMGKATDLTVDAGAGIDTFIYSSVAASPTGERDTIKNFQASGAEADKIELDITTGDLDGVYDHFVFLGSVSGTEGDVNRKFAQLNEGVGINNTSGESVLTALYDKDTGALYFDTNTDGIIGSNDARDLSVVMSGLEGSFTFDNFEAASVGRVVSLTQLQTIVDAFEEDPAENPLPPYIVLRDSADRLLNNEEQVGELIENVDGQVQITGEVSDEQRDGLDTLLDGADNYIVIEEVDPVDPGDVPVDPDAPPELVDRTPPDNEGDVDVEADLQLVFTKDVEPGTGNFSIFNGDDGTLFEAIAADGPNAIFAGDTVTLDPLADLEFGADYFVRVQPTAVQDVDGNPFAGFNDPEFWNFTTAEEGFVDPTIDIQPITQADDNVNFDADTFRTEAGNTVRFEFAEIEADNGFVPVFIQNFSAGDQLETGVAIDEASYEFGTPTATTLQVAFDWAALPDSYIVYLEGIDAGEITQISDALVAEDTVQEIVTLVGTLDGFSADWLVA